MVSNLQVLLKSSFKVSKSLIRKAMVIFLLVNYVMVRHDDILLESPIKSSVIVLTNLGEKLNEDEVNELLKEVEVGKDGRINYVGK
jgi:hypothetical protein